MGQTDVSKHKCLKVKREDQVISRSKYLDFELNTRDKFTGCPLHWHLSITNHSHRV